jgi:hypothetical protein
VCIVHFRNLLQEEPDLRAFLEAFPDRIVHFVLDLHSLEGDLNDIEWDYSQDERFLTVADTRVEDPWASLDPAIHMQVEYAELREHLGVIAFKEGCGEDA